MPDDLTNVLLALTRKHKRYLIDANAARLITKPKLKTDAQRLARLAEVLGVDGVAPYRLAYLHRRSHYANLYEPINTRLTTEDLAFAIRQRHRDAAAGIEPVLQHDEPPKFNRLYQQPDDSYLLDFVSLGDERFVRSGYGFVRDSPVNHDWISIRRSPNIVLIGGRTTQDHDALYRVFCETVGRPVDAFVLRAFDRPADWQALQAKFKAEVGGHDGNRRGDTEPAAYSMHARKGKPLRNVTKWQSLAIDHSTARELMFYFELRYKTDGYPELVVFYLNLLNGQIKFLDEISEYALRRVCDEYLTIVRRP